MNFEMDCNYINFMPFDDENNLMWCSIVQVRRRNVGSKRVVHIMDSAKGFLTLKTTVAHSKPFLLLLNAVKMTSAQFTSRLRTTICESLHPWCREKNCVITVNIIHGPSRSHWELSSFYERNLFHFQLLILKWKFSLPQDSDPHKTPNVYSLRLQASLIKVLIYPIDSKVLVKTIFSSAYRC